MMNTASTALSTDPTAILTVQFAHGAPHYRASRVPVGGARSFSLASSVQACCSVPRFVALYGRVRRCVNYVHLASFPGRSPGSGYESGQLRCEPLTTVSLVCVPRARFAARSGGLLSVARSAIPVRR